MSEIKTQGRQQMTWAEFLERIPPVVTVEIEDLIKRNYRNEEEFSNPDIHIFCNSDKCKGMRFFRCEYPQIKATTGSQEVFIPTDVVIAVQFTDALVA